MTSKGKEEEEKQIDIFKSRLVPQCRILSEKEEKEFLEKNNISKNQLPLIRLKDPVVKAINAKKGDVIEFVRENDIAGFSKYYRVVEGE